MKTAFLAAAVAASLLLGACSTTSPDVIRPGDAQRLSTVQDAVVLHVRPVVVEGQQSGVGGVSGAVIGGIAGGAVGYTMDKQIKELKEQTAGSGVDVTETDNGQAILVNLPEGVTFDVGSYSLKPEFRATLDKVADSLKQYPDSLIDVYGHTDSTGSDAYNQTLSENRARTVANYLSMQGVSPARIRSQGYGETMPVASNDTPEGRARNRRVEIKIVPVTQEQVQAARQGS